jgi:hypothetical protein
VVNNGPCAAAAEDGLDGAARVFFQDCMVACHTGCTRFRVTVARTSEVLTPEEQVCSVHKRNSDAYSDTPLHFH